MLKGSTSLISDLIASRSSMLFLGCPGVGKTSVLRECARLLAKNKLRVEVIDTSNEIAGDCDIPHVAIGKARRMMVKRREDQHKTMIEAVQNHMPQCIIVDEIGTYSEALAAADIAQRGVQIVATAHGTQIKHLLRSPQLNRLVGGVHTVVVGDKDKEKKGLNKKSVEERIAAPVFDAIVEMHSAHEWAIFKNVDKVVDAILGMQPFSYELRKRDHNTGVMSIIKECKN